MQTEQQLRFRGKTKTPLERVTELDAFPKLKESSIKPSAVGGFMTVVSLLLIVWLFKSEFAYFWDSKLHFKLRPDDLMDEKLPVNIDITIAMPCRTIGADVVDSTGQGVTSFGELEYEDTWFELDSAQRDFFSSLKYVNEYLREEAHALQQVLWKASLSRTYDMPERTTQVGKPHDACRISGTLELTKVAGNLHVAAGQTLPLPGGHAHFAGMRHNLNFSHRITRLSFGPPDHGVVHPLEGDEKIADQEDMQYQYFITVVPTEVHVRGSNVRTYQYSVREADRPISHAKGSHGVPGVYFKYDSSSLRVTITEERDSWFTLLTKLCAVVGGVFATSAVISQKIQAFLGLFSGKPEYQKMTKS
ncbi:endoplasmic reticulum-Golgi intermediate compartment protein 2 [Neocloeon triangulifer]|uniref:endoplasmic reticulum-Golgi intermediate compartment protein 2 n=1 Tax=Neocloeon triangulifer TaxID=2078957 RepID=UPI00286F84DE|nr:endoplasmic reticulum-Golgi intermediate compartment protein 2 [Neocloeon triangulifer]